MCVELAVYCIPVMPMQNGDSPPPEAFAKVEILKRKVQAKQIAVEKQRVRIGKRIAQLQRVAQSV